MGFLDKILKPSAIHSDWKVQVKGTLHDLSYDEIVASLGRPQKAKGGFVYWRMPLTDLDPDYPENESFELSNKDYRSFGSSTQKPTTDRDKWFIVSTSERAIRIIANELGAFARNIEPNEQ